MSNVTVLNWVHALSEEIELTLAAMDEMHTYCGSQKTIDPYGLLLIDMEKNHPFRNW